jgi:hypothetical protein
MWVKSTSGCLRASFSTWGQYPNEVAKITPARSCRIIPSMTFSASAVSGTFSCSMSLTPSRPATFLAATQWARFQP